MRDRTAARASLSPLSSMSFGGRGQPHRLEEPEATLILAGMALVLGLCAPVAGRTEIVQGLLSTLAAHRAHDLPAGHVFVDAGGQRLTDDEVAAVLPDLPELARRAGMRRLPDVYLLPDRTPNAFATGSADQGAIAVTCGLLERFSSEGVRAVLAHEFGHLLNRDAAVLAKAAHLVTMTDAACLAAGLMLVIDLLCRTERPMPWPVRLLCLITLPTSARLLFGILSRRREYGADRRAADLLGEPHSVIAALREFQGSGSSFASPAPTAAGEVWSGLLSSHPQPDERVRRLMVWQP